MNDIFYLMVAFAIIFLLRSMVSKPNQAVTNIPTQKPCPPHKWRSIEVKDPEGNTSYWYLTCDKCGPLNKQQVPETWEDKDET